MKAARIDCPISVDEIEKMRPRTSPWPEVSDRTYTAMVNTTSVCLDATLRELRARLNNPSDVLMAEGPEGLCQVIAEFTMAREALDREDWSNPCISGLKTQFLAVLPQVEAGEEEAS